MAKTKWQLGRQSSKLSVEFDEVFTHSMLDSVELDEQGNEKPGTWHPDRISIANDPHRVIARWMLLNLNAMS